MEGPSIVILREELQEFKGKPVLEVSGNTKEPKEELQGKILQKIETWGKVLYLTFAHPRKKTDVIITKTHFMMFGSYRINDPKEDRIPRIQLTFAQGVVYFYACAFKFIDRETFLIPDRRVDVLSPEYDPKYVVKLMKGRDDIYLCDLFLDQELFSGAGNIVKNEVLFNLRRHPLTKLGEIDKKDWKKLVEAVKSYCWDFYKWKKVFELRKHWQVYKKPVCSLCGKKINRQKMGKRQRSEFFCPNCQSKKQNLQKLIVHPVLPPPQGKTVREKRLDH